MEYKQIFASGLLTYEDFKQNIFYQIRKYLLLIFIFTLGISSFFISAFCFRFTMNGDPMSIWIESVKRSVSISILLLLIVWIIVWISIRRTYRKYQTMQEEKKYSIDKEGIHQKSIAADLYIEWMDIFKIHESNKLFHIYLSKNKVVVLPKSFFQSKEDILLFKKFIKDNMSANKVQ